MHCADPWDEIPRLESLLEAELNVALESSRLYASAEAFCTDACRVDDRCPLAETIVSRYGCPLWRYVRSEPLMS